MPTMNRTLSDSFSAEEISYSETSMTLEWDYDSDSSVDYFNLYHKTHDSTVWLLLDSTENSIAEFSVEYSVLGSGSWDFGVAAVDFDGSESEIHSSLDTTADPDTGWYLTWNV